jgi:hypothetical protein
MDTGGTQSFEAATEFGKAFDKMKAAEADSDSEPQEEKPKATKAPKEAKPKAEVKKSLADLKLPSAKDLADLANPKAEHAEPEAESVSEDADEQIPTNMTKKAQEAWAGMRKEFKEEQKRRQELEAKVAEYEKSSASAEEVEKLKAQNSEYEKELQVARVEATQEFKEAVLAPMSKVQASISALAAKYEISEKELFESLVEPEGDRITDLAAGMNDRDRFRLYETADQFVKVQTIREKVVNNAKLALEKIQSHRETQAKEVYENYTKEYKNSLENTWKDLAEKIPLFQRIEGNEDWNAQIDEVENFARSVDMNDPNPEFRSAMALRAAVSPLLLNQVNVLFDKLKTAQAALAKYQGAKPKAGGGVSPSASGSAPVEQYDDFLEALRDNLK